MMDFTLLFPGQGVILSSPVDDEPIELIFRGLVGNNFRFDWSKYENGKYASWAYFPFLRGQRVGITLYFPDGDLRQVEVEMEYPEVLQIRLT